MAEFKLKVSPEQMIQQAETVRKEANIVKMQFEKVEETIINSSCYWEGDASDLHRQSFKKIMTKYETLTKSLIKRPDDLLKMAGLYKETEQQATQESVSLPNNIIF